MSNKCKNLLTFYTDNSYSYNNNLYSYNNNLYSYNNNLYSYNNNNNNNLYKNNQRQTEYREELLKNEVIDLLNDDMKLIIQKFENLNI